ncbi:Thioredoxin-like fold protein [Metarhizium guizhouense ARSEF 977]|uniref:Thioredoxin-like fold protein n=1 Tax=Metarhizium guizhouense (strain ARSEF 977) TaxID=1276136 RepID=A0A0B4GP23_METGA|nr:Thioredoxin-like fold protein [Metarhizium guizhouense ARSEF 977]
MPVLAINSKDGQDLVIASNKKVVVAITSPYLAQCNGVEKTIEELSEMYRDIVFVSADHGEFPPRVGGAANYMVPWVIMYKEGEKIDQWNFPNKITLAERIEAFATDRPLASAEPLQKTRSG